MMAENLSDENVTTERAPILPDGIGLTVEQVRALLLKAHDVAIPADDPALMYVTIMNAALTEQAKLQAAHQAALGKLMAEHTKNYVESTKAGMTEIMGTLSKLTTDGLNDAAKDMVKFRTTMFFCTAITFLSALLVVGVFVLKGIYNG